MSRLRVLRIQILAFMELREAKLELGYGIFMVWRSEGGNDGANIPAARWYVVKRLLGWYDELAH